MINLKDDSAFQLGVKIANPLCMERFLDRMAAIMTSATVLYAKHEPVPSKAYITMHVVNGGEHEYYVGGVKVQELLFGVFSYSNILEKEYLFCFRCSEKEYISYNFELNPITHSSN